MVNLSFSQSSCACDEWFGSCNIVCPKGSMASCQGTWYGSCKCQCLEMVAQPVDKLDSFMANNTIEIKDVEKMLKIFEETNNENLLALSNFKTELSKNSENGIYSSKKTDEFNKYFNELKTFFNTLSFENKHKLVNLIES
jgi:hypothetical protein